MFWSPSPSSLCNGAQSLMCVCVCVCVCGFFLTKDVPFLFAITARLVSIIVIKFTKADVIWAISVEHVLIKVILNLM